ncbi:MAG: glycosyltransferase family 2 protein [Clostridia bacterium]|nr:glycosyltransferase family 2 protein [Clostridia bacterium]
MAQISDKPLVSVIIPCYNAERFLPIVFKCFNRQTYRNFQLIFVDDGSTDGTLCLLKEYCNNNPSHTLISGENKGAASARNDGLKVIKGELFTFCDSDDIITDNHLELGLKYIIQENADMAVCKIKRIAGKRTDKFNFDRTPRAKKVQLFGKYSAIEQYFSQEIFDFLLMNKFYRTDVLLKSGARFLDNTRYGEEAYFMFKYLSFSDKTVYYGAKTYVYVQHKTSLMHSKFNESRLDVYTNLTAVIREIKSENNHIAVLPYVKVMRAGYSVGLLHFILHSDYRNKCVIKRIKTYLKKDVKSLKVCKKAAFYKKMFLPICAFISKIVF